MSEKWIYFFFSFFFLQTDQWLLSVMCKVFSYLYTCLFLAFYCFVCKFMLKMYNADNLLYFWYISQRKQQPASAWSQVLPLEVKWEPSSQNLSDLKNWMKRKTDVNCMCQTHFPLHYWHKMLHHSLPKHANAKDQRLDVYLRTKILQAWIVISNVTSIIDNIIISSLANMWL